MSGGDGEGTPSAVGLGHLRWPRIEEERPLLLVPVGSTEQHGPHLPVATDSMIAHAVARTASSRLVAAGSPVRVAPTVAYGASGEHEEFPGTISIGQQALELLLVELGRSACRWAQGVVLVNAHGGNAHPVRRAVQLLRHEGRAVAWTSCALPGADAHAGRTETSLMLHLAPWVVRADLATAGETAPIASLLPVLRQRGVRAVSPNGVLGDPGGSTPAQGRALLESLVDRLVEEIRVLDVGDDGRLTLPTPPTPPTLPTPPVAPSSRPAASAGTP